MPTPTPIPAADPCDGLTADGPCDDHARVTAADGRRFCWDCAAYFGGEFATPRDTSRVRQWVAESNLAAEEG